jgi:hypothetical protein
LIIRKLIPMWIGFNYFMMGLKTHLVWIINHFWQFEIPTPWFLCVFIIFFVFMHFYNFVNIVFGLGFLCVVSEYIFLVWRWCAIKVVFIICDVCVYNDSYRCQHGNAQQKPKWPNSYGEASKPSLASSNFLMVHHMQQGHHCWC